MLVHLHNPKRDVEVPGPVRVNDLVRRLGLNRESVLVIRGDSLVTGDARGRERERKSGGDEDAHQQQGDARLEEGDDIEIRPVISGGAR